MNSTREQPALEGTLRDANRANALASQLLDGQCQSPRRGKLGAYDVLSLAPLLPWIPKRIPLPATMVEQCQLLPLSGTRALRTNAILEIGITLETGAVLVIGAVLGTSSVPGIGTPESSGACLWKVSKNPVPARCLAPPLSEGTIGVQYPDGVGGTCRDSRSLTACKASDFDGTTRLLVMPRVGRGSCTRLDTPTWRIRWHQHRFRGSGVAWLGLHSLCSLILFFC